MPCRYLHHSCSLKQLGRRRSTCASASFGRQEILECTSEKIYPCTLFRSGSRYVCHSSSIHTRFAAGTSCSPAKAAGKTVTTSEPSPPAPSSKRAELAGMAMCRNVLLAGSSSARLLSHHRRGERPFLWNTISSCIQSRNFTCYNHGHTELSVVHFGFCQDSSTNDC